MPTQQKVSPKTIKKLHDRIEELEKANDNLRLQAKQGDETSLTLAREDIRLTQWLKDSQKSAERYERRTDQAYEETQEKRRELNGARNLLTIFVSYFLGSHSVAELFVFADEGAEGMGMQADETFLNELYLAVTKGASAAFREIRRERKQMLEAATQKERPTVITFVVKDMAEAVQTLRKVGAPDAYIRYALASQMQIEADEIERLLAANPGPYRGQPSDQEVVEAIRGEKPAQA